MEFKEAKEMVLPFGKHRGETIDKIAETDRGLLYLDWLRNWMAEVEHSNVALYQAIEAYLEDPSIAAGLADAIADKAGYSEDPGK